jgi:cell division protease FtsH
MSSVRKNLVFWIVAAFVIYLFWSVSSRIQKNERQLSFSEFMEQLERGHVAKVTIRGSSAGSEIVGEFKNDQAFRTFAPPGVQGLVTTLLEHKVEVKARDANSSSWLGHIISWTPIVILIAFLIFFMRQMAGSPAASQAERRLAAKARIHDLLARNGDEGLSQEEISEKLEFTDREELQTVLYQMLREDTVVFTAGRKYRPRVEV